MHLHTWLVVDALQQFHVALANYPQVGGFVLMEIKEHINNIIEGISQKDVAALPARG
jgi:hypothetical protein